MTETFDPHAACLSGAYVVKGFWQALGKNPPQDTIDFYGGEVGLMAHLSSFGVEIEKLWVEFNRDDAPGVWDYDVSEELGAWLGRQLLYHATLPDWEATRIELLRRALQFFAQGEPA